MKVEDMLFIALLAIGATSLILRGLIRDKRIKPNKISRLFYQDDETFINYWRKKQEKGKVRFVVNNIMIMCIYAAVMGVSLKILKSQNLSVYVFVIGAAVSGFLSLTLWEDNQNKYNRLIEEEKINEI